MNKTIPSFSLNTFVAPMTQAGDWYRNVNYEDAKNIIKEKMLSSAESFVAIGYYLKHISENQQYLEDGYENIWECAKKEFGFSKGRTSRCINICKAYSVDGDSPLLDERFKNFNTSQLQEMLSIKDEHLIEQITPDMNYRKIRDMKNAKKEKEVVGSNALPGQMQITTIEGDFREFELSTNGERIEENIDKLGGEIIADEEKKDLQDISTVIINYSGCYSEFCKGLTEREMEIFKKGVLAERERVWDKLADILDENAKGWILQLGEV